MDQFRVLQCKCSLILTNNAVLDLTCRMGNIEVLAGLFWWFHFSLWLLCFEFDSSAWTLNTNIAHNWFLRNLDHLVYWLVEASYSFYSELLYGVIYVLILVKLEYPILNVNHRVCVIWRLFHHRVSNWACVGIWVLEIAWNLRRVVLYSLSLHCFNSYCFTIKCCYSLGITCWSWGLSDNYLLSNLDKFINISIWSTSTKVKINALVSWIEILVKLEVVVDNWYNRILLHWSTNWIHNRVRDWAQILVGVLEIWWHQVLSIDCTLTCGQISHNWVVVIFNNSLRIACYFLLLWLDLLSNLYELINLTKRCTSTKVKINTLVFSIHITVDLEVVVCNWYNRIWLDWSKGWIHNWVRDWA